MKRIIRWFDGIPSGYQGIYGMVFSIIVIVGVIAIRPQSLIAPLLIFAYITLIPYITLSIFTRIPCSRKWAGLEQEG